MTKSAFMFKFKRVAGSIFFLSGIEFCFEAEIQAHSNFFPARSNFFRAGTPLEFIHERTQNSNYNISLLWNTVVQLK